MIKQFKDTIIVLFRKIQKLFRKGQNFVKRLFLSYHLTRFLLIPLTLASLRLSRLNKCRQFELFPPSF